MNSIELDNGIVLSNPREAVQMQDGTVSVQLDILEPGASQPEPAVYSVVHGDTAPAAQWLRGLIQSQALPITPISTPELTLRYWEDVRMKRDQLLAESDIEVLPDRWALMSPEEQHAWATYRQALRDIPANHEDPLQIEWPKKPT